MKVNRFKLKEELPFFNNLDIASLLDSIHKNKKYIEKKLKKLAKSKFGE